MPLVVYIHGGGWRQGGQWRPPFQPRLVDRGIAIAAITYRFSHEAPFPAPLHDCKAAVRWLRAHAAQFGIDATRIGAWGISAGGHLASLLGVTNEQPDWEGSGPYAEHSSAVAVVCAWCGPADLERVFTDETPSQGMVEMVSDLLGGADDDVRERAREASPITYVRWGAPPYLLVHGADDAIVPPYHSRSLHRRLVDAGVASSLHIVPNTGHALESLATARLVDAFFNAYLRP